MPLPPHTLPRGPRGQGVELWLLRPGARKDLTPSLAAFAGLGPARVLGPPAGEGAHWAKAFAAAGRVPLELRRELAPVDGDAGDPSAFGWAVLERALSGGGAAVLAVVTEPLLGQVVAHALGFPRERASALRVDPGRAVLLRDDSIGIVLRHSNVPGPVASSGMALPGARVEPSR